MSTKILITNVRVSYAHVFEPTAIAGNTDLKYSCSALIPVNDVNNLNQISAAMGEAFQQGLDKKTWGAKVPAIMKNPLRNGAEKDHEKNPEYAGMMFVSASNTNKPMVVDRSRNPITDAAGFYSGCYANVLVNFFPFSKAGNNGVGCSLLGVQFVSDGEHLANGASVDDFAQIDPAQGAAQFVAPNPFIQK